MAWFLTRSPSPERNEGGEGEGLGPGSSRPDAAKKKVLITLCGGGFLWEARALIRGMGDGFDYHFVTTPDSTAGVRIEMASGRVHFVSHITATWERSVLKVGLNLLASFRDAYRVLRSVDPVAVVCVGSSIAVPLCFWAKWLGKKAVFVESITRVTTPSMTARIVDGLGLCDRCYVQWPESAKLYRRGVYRGTVL